MHNTRLDQSTAPGYPLDATHVLSAVAAQAPAVRHQQGGRVEVTLVNVLTPLLGYLAMLWLILHDRRRLPTSTALEALWRKRRILATGSTLLLATVVIPLFLLSLRWIVLAYYAITLSMGGVAVSSLAVYAARVAAKHTSAIR